MSVMTGLRKSGAGTPFVVGMLPATARAQASLPISGVPSNIGIDTIAGPVTLAIGRF